MNRLRRVSRSSAGEGGAAIILTLLSIVLISILVVAFLVSMRTDRLSTQSYSQSIRVQELAKGASEEILSDLKMEIAAGSLAGNEFNVDGRQVFVPSSALASQPARIGFKPGTGSGDYTAVMDGDRIPPSLIRVSRAAVDYAAVFPAASYDAAKLPPQRASAVSSGLPSANGRSVPPKRWNMPLLMGPDPSTRFANKPPDWIYFTRSGSRPYTDADLAKLKSSKNLDLTEPVLGRYAFVMYDEGSLLDINSSGFPSTLAGQPGGAAAIRGKSASLYAALETLPGLSSKKPELDAFFAWRNKGSIAAEGGFLAAAKKWMEHGFREVGGGDNPLLSRKDLIDYFTKKIGTTEPLPYLGTFSRHLAAPSARPVTPWNDLNGDGVKDSGESFLSSINYGADADKPASANRDLANVRFSSDATVTHYSDDATSKTYEVKKGDPLLQSRFSLARLAWLQDGNPSTGDGPSGAKETAIKACFGLVWDHPGGTGANRTANGGNKCWNYVGPNGAIGAPPASIKTMAEVAAERREPDFFELLKAAILSGSLGKDSGPAAFNNGDIGPAEDFNYRNASETLTPNRKMGALGFYSHTFGPSSPVYAPARISDMQIIRIGANIIDQYDADSYPTAVYFKYNGVNMNDPATNATGYPIFGPVTMAYGNENLPYLAFVRQLNGSLNRPSGGNPGPGTDLTVTSISGWLQPFLWNPHQQTTRTLQDRPTEFQIRAYGSVKMVWSYDENPTDEKYLLKTYAGGVSRPVDYYQTNSRTETCNAGTINFKDSQATSLFYGKPYPLLRGSASDPSSPDPRAYGDSKMAFTSGVMPDYGVANAFVAFPAGETPSTDEGGGLVPFYVLDLGTPTANPDPKYKDVKWSGYGAISNRPDGATPAITYALGWKDASGNFHPYSYMTGTFGWTGIKLTQTPGYPNIKVGSADPTQVNADNWMLADPRTERFSIGFSFWGSLSESITQYRMANQRFGAMGKPLDPAFKGIMYSQAYRHSAGDHMVNSANSATHTSYYSDPDGVVRPGDGFHGDPATGDGMMLFINNGTPTGTPFSPGDKAVTTHGRRPVILNRPFQSVGELGYVFRDQPFKTLDLFSDKSADTALLDLFCLNDYATISSDKLLPIGSGRVNVNAASVPVLSALLQGGAKKELDDSYNLGTESNALATSLAGRILKNGSYAPFKGYRELCPALVDALRASTASSADKGNKAYLEAPLRALAEATDFRTWNLMIDLVAQSGRMSPDAGKLENFTVQGEYHVWIHAAIDRYTGEIIALQWEPVYE